MTFVPVDFACEDWMDKLVGAGFDTSAPTLFLWEGVTYYLTDDVIEATMRRIAGCACALVAYDVYYKWFSLDARTVAASAARSVRSIINIGCLFRRVFLPCEGTFCHGHIV